MTQTEKIYTGLSILFSGIIIIGNLTYQKFVVLNIPLIHSFELSVGAILYPITFLISDLIAEFYGKEKANFCVKFAILMNIIIAIILGCMDYLHATSWSKIDDNMFHIIFGFYGVAFIGSLIACYISQKIDILLYLRIKTLTGSKYLGLRNFLSSSISLFIDTFIVVGFMTIFGILQIEYMWLLIGNSYSWKLFFTICMTPLFYLCAFMIRKSII
jgi:uncharacterized integral membrane protein (TIGR00697 family)